MKSTRIKPPSYSYNKFKSEDTKIYKRMALLAGITVIILAVLWFWGVSFLQLLGGLNLNNSGGDNGITIPLQKPNLSDLPEFTNKETLNISGSTSPKTAVTLFLNGSQAGKTTTSTNGTFTFVDIKLKQGLNLIKVVVKDDKGQSEDLLTSVTYDNVAPQLQVTQPTDKQNFKKETTSITIVGSTDADATVFINSIQTTNSQSGSFTYNLNVSPGENEIEVKSTDKAGNETVKNLTVTVSD